MTSVTLSEISFSITKNLQDLSNLVKGPGFDPTWIEKLKRNPRKAKSFTGNFAVTYHFQSKKHGGRVTDFGIRMWHSKVKEDDLKRYRLLNRELEKLNKASPGYIRFAPMEIFEPEKYGFLVKGKRHPCLKMEWQDAENLDIFIDNIMNDKNINLESKKNLFREIKQKVLETGDTLHRMKCSHGDLSSGNIMLSQQKDGSIKIHVIDFDSFYSESLSNLRPSSIGHEDWQHPGYISGKLDMFGLKSDFCPLLTLIITLEALATDIDLYDQFAPPSQDGSGILIRKKDLVSPENSPVLRAMLDLNNSILTTYIDDLVTILNEKNISSIKRPNSVHVNRQVARPAVSAIVSKHEVSSKPKRVQKSWQMRKKIESESDLKDALEGGATQMTIVKALHNYNFQKKFNDKSMLKFYQIVTQHFGGLEKCVEDLQTQYIWSLHRVGEDVEANKLANDLFEANPSNPNIGYLVFNRLRKQKEWQKLLEASSRALDLTPSNVHVNIFHATAILNLSEISVSEAFADARVRTNDDWRLICDIIGLCSRRKYFDEDLILELFPILMKSLDEKKVRRQIRNKSSILYTGIINFLSAATKFENTSLPTSISMVNISALKLCKQLPQNWEKTVEKKFIQPSKNRISEFKDLHAIANLEKYDLIEVISNLSIFGVGEAHLKLSESLQFLINSFEWNSVDNLPIAASFDVEQPSDAMIVWVNNNWYYSKDRTRIWDSRTGNIW